MDCVQFVKDADDHSSGDVVVVTEDTYRYLRQHVKKGNAIEYEPKPEAADVFEEVVTPTAVSGFVVEPLTMHSDSDDEGD